MTSSFDAAVSSRKRRILSIGKEIQSINDMGRQALTKPSLVLTFKGMYKALERNYTKFESIWEEIVDLYEEEGRSKDFPAEKESNTKETVKSFYYEANSNYEAICEAHLNLSANTTFSESKPHHALPRMPINKFDGDIMHWPKFRDTFISLVHSDTTLTDIQKFHYLLSSLSDEACSPIKHFNIESGNYTLAWQTLLGTYDNKRILASTYLNNILSFEPLRGKSPSEELQQYTAHVLDNITAFELLKIPQASKFILFHLAINLLDDKTRELFETQHKDITFPTAEQLKTFVKERSLSLQFAKRNYIQSKVEHSTHKNNDHKKHSPSHHKPNNHMKTTLLSGVSDKKPVRKCFVCKQGPHNIIECEDYHNATPSERLNLLKSWSGCRNCLSSTHKTNECKSKWTCRYCKHRHHSTLHISYRQAKSTSSEPSTNKINSDNEPVASLNCMSSHTIDILLGTVCAKIKDVKGNYQTFRLIVDSGSQQSFITQSLVKRLGLNVQHCRRKISGIGKTIFEETKGKTSCDIKDHAELTPSLHTDALVVKTITSNLPSLPVPSFIYSQLKSYKLADPKFWEPRPIDFLLGVDLYADIITGVPFTVQPSLPKLIPSIFGHIVIGRYETDYHPSPSLTLFSLNVNDDLSSELQRFWKVEEISHSIPFTNAEDEACEEHFVKTHHRNEQGQYVVSLPWKSERPIIQNSSYLALKRFYNLEHKLKSNPSLKKQYSDFMQEYIDLKHMEPTKETSDFVIPHHSIMKDDRNTMKIRVVFDASAKAKCSSLNDHLMIGPKLQRDIKDILLGFRMHRYVFVADIVKMYRNILLNENDCSYQHIFWQFKNSEALQKYKLKTVTYGLSCAPFLAIRVIEQLIKDEGENFPNAARILKTDIYVDDIVTGEDTLERAMELQKEVISLMACGKFKLDKWASNHPDLLKFVNPSPPNSTINFIDPDTISLKILGLQWNPTVDSFTYRIQEINYKLTKRSILSVIAKIYDPLGFVSPTTLVLKGLMQDLWKEQLGWDDIIPDYLGDKWRRIARELPHLSKLIIPRFLETNPHTSYQLIAFSDASMAGYCAAIYIRQILKQDTRVNLLLAKTKVAPLKTLSVPKLELCGALLLAKLFASLPEMITRSPSLNESVFFTDSSIVLSWINTPTYKLKTFVANRVSEICNLTPKDQWKHVTSECNPADIGSRGLLPLQLINNSLWWSGPHWLTLPESCWPQFKGTLTSPVPELKASVALLSYGGEQSTDKWMQRFSKYNTLIRVIAWMKRFIYNTTHSDCKSTGWLRFDEINNAKETCIKLIQQEMLFTGKDGQKLKINYVCNTLAKLRPFIDDRGLLRVGGRLCYSSLPYNQKHPIFIPKGSHLSTLIVDHYHQMYLHPGPSLLQAVIQHSFWIPAIRRLIRHRTKKCLQCYKFTAKPYNPIMGNLPTCRLNEVRPFLHTGIDMAGPFICKEMIRRKAPLVKTYLCLFVCMTTKAVHVELVCRLSTEDFLAAFKRFIARRGLPSSVYSDNATNFTGASKYLDELLIWRRKEETSRDISNYANHMGISWNFIPPRAPHFGGLWESSIKSVKQILRRVMGDNILTIEELTTLFVQIEGMLNSRPLCPLSSDPQECDYLSPGHFLISTPILSVPEPSLLDTRENLLSRWQLVQRTSQQIWKRWSSQYLRTLQERTKWENEGSEPKEGDLVLIQDLNTSPLEWPMGRITSLTKGRDGVARVAHVRTPNGDYKRATRKLIPLLPVTASFNDA